MAVDVKPGAAWGLPRELFPTRIPAGGGFTNVFRYDVSRDGRFLMVTEPSSDNVTPSPFTVVLNWAVCLKR